MELYNQITQFLQASTTLTFHRGFFINLYLEISENIPQIDF